MTIGRYSIVFIQSSEDIIEDIVIPDPSKTDNKSNKSFWAYIKHCKTDSIGIPPIKDMHATLHTDPVGKAEVLNKQFQSAFSPPTPRSVRQACQNIIPQAGEPHPTMQDIQISKHDIEKLLGNLKPHKAAGPDKIKPIILKELAPSVASMLHIIFQKSLHTGKVPGEWKTADIAAVYKKGNRQVASNYRVQTHIPDLHLQQTAGAYCSQLHHVPPRKQPYPSPAPTWL